MLEEQGPAAHLLDLSGVKKTDVVTVGETGQSSFDPSVFPRRNCGNVFCASCCDQKIPVPSQQLFEPSRVCKTCYSSLQLSPAPLELELEKPIAASSN